MDSAAERLLSDLLTALMLNGYISECVQCIKCWWEDMCCDANVLHYHTDGEEPWGGFKRLRFGGKWEELLACVGRRLGHQGTSLSFCRRGREGEDY